MNEGLRRRAMLRASQEGKTFTQIVEEAVANLLSAETRSVKRKVPNLPVSKGRGLQPGVNLEDNASTLDLMDSDLPLTRRR
jgi:hypothetical protein